MVRQRSAPSTVLLGSDAFGPSETTRIAWLGGGGFFVNARGTRLMIDPAISPGDVNHRLLVPFPIEAKDVPPLDAVLYTHADADHLAMETAGKLTAAGFYGTAPIVTGLPGARLVRVGEPFDVGSVTVTPTPADHPWQLLDPARFGAPWGPDDCCGYLLDTPDGRIWCPGDTRLLPQHLEVQGVDVLLLDASDDTYHLSVEGAARIAEATGARHLIPYHYGTYDAPDSVAFNGDPAWVAARISRADERMHVLAPGELFTL